jgi:hypothetical protein
MAEAPIMSDCLEKGPAMGPWRAAANAARSAKAILVKWGGSAKQDIIHSRPIFARCFICPPRVPHGSLLVA